MSRASVALLAVLLAAPGAARAQDVDARAVTLLAGRPDVRDGVVHTVVPLYQLISLNARGIDAGVVDDLRIVLSAWGRVDPAEPVEDRLLEGDIEVGYLEGTLADKRLRLRLGRQLVFAGATRAEGVDGVMGEVRFGMVGLMAYGGAPVTPRFGWDRGDATWGARLSLRRTVDAEVGLSYAHARDDGRESRFDFGVDGRWSPSRRLIVTALGLWSAAENRLAEARLAAGFEPARRWHVQAEAARTAPDLFLSRASVLSVFAEDSRNELGAIVSFRPSADLRLRGNYHLLGNEDGTGHRAEVQADLDVARGALVGIEAGALTIPDDGYLRCRVFGRSSVRRAMLVSLEGDLVRLEEERNGTRLSARAAAAWRWDPTPRWRAVLSAAVASDPYAEARFEAMARLAWNYDQRGTR
jgi:hypothetical protein